MERSPMSRDKAGRMPGSPGEWMDHAESDLRLARLAASDPSIRRELGCFHAQQAAEKAIKALLLSLKIEFPPTHDIEILLRLAEDRLPGVPETVRNAGLLRPYAVETRYPGFPRDIASADIDEALIVAD